MGFLYELFRPTDNRHHVGSKRHKLLYIIRYVPVSFILGVALVTYPQDRPFWLSATAGIAILGVVGYFTLDKWEDGFLWRGLYSRFYRAHDARSAGHQAMKAYEDDPTAENIEALHKVIKEEK